MSIAEQPTETNENDAYGLADLIAEQALMLGAGSTVFFQLAEKGVGLGVAEHSTTLQRPADRLRTTMTYVYVMILGSEEERRAISKMVNRAHRTVRSPGRYTAFDPELQLWVAATLAHNGIFIHERIWGPPSPEVRLRLYRDAQIFGNALQVRPEQWPETLEEFDAYWEQKIADLEPDPAVQDFCHRLITQGAPVWLRWMTPLQALLDRGNLDPHTREILGFEWTAKDQQRYDLFWRAFPPIYRRMPRRLRQFPARLTLWDMRRRMRTGARVI
ncbi:oxygenase MpaB family protein [Nocardioides sp. NPDC057577]|uniref:oxygenase MpaB family protein n=1 Tax=Nocardioides sp. NPDC057577 TaxID=3346171 RepID=UPI00366D59A6